MVARLARWVRNAEEVLDLQPEELGGIILRALVEDGGDVHLHNFVVGLRQVDEVYPRAFTDRIERAIGEAWSWLEAQGLIASTGDAWQFVTRRGKAVSEAQAFADFRKASLLPRELLHPTLSASAWRNFIRGNHDTAAFKAVEEAVRAAAGYSARDIGTDLMRKAFHPDDGPLSDMSVLPAERQALAALFSARSAPTRTRSATARSRWRTRPKPARCSSSPVTFCESSRRARRCARARPHERP